MDLEMQVHMGLLVLLAALLSGIVGLNREQANRTAGLRTHILVGMGACVFTLLSLNAFSGGDPARVAAQIVSGLGFLGAGAIIKQKDEVKGLTTAASLWATAGIGMAIGSGAWVFGVIITIIMWFVLHIVWKAETQLSFKEPDGRTNPDSNAD